MRTLTLTCVKCTRERTFSGTDSTAIQRFVAKSKWAMTSKGAICHKCPK